MFIALQSTAIAHATQYTEASHSHEGLLCEVEAIATEHDVIEPAVIDLHDPEVEFVERNTSVFVSQNYITPPGRAPPPRSPPTPLF